MNTQKKMASDLNAQGGGKQTFAKVPPKRYAYRPNDNKPSSNKKDMYSPSPG